MEVVGGVSSVATLLELTSKFLLYLKDVKHGPADRARLIAELDSTKHLLEQLQNRIKNLPTVGDDVTSKPTAFMTSLVIQSGPFDQCEKILNALLKKMCQLPHELRAHYQQFKQDQRLPNVNDILGILKDVVSEFTTFYVIMDALDECTNNEVATLELIDTIRSLSSTVKLMCTSRPIPVFERHFEKLEKTMKLEISAHTDDIKLFLLAKLHLDSLAWQLTAADIRKSLKALPKTLDETYKAALHRIRSQSPEANLNKTGEMVLFWVVFAQRPLTINELRHAYAALNLSEGQSITEEDLPDEDALTSLCCGLLSVDKELATVRMVHYTTKEHFQSSLYENEINDAHLSMSKSCLSYLMQPELGKEGVIDRTLDFIDKNLISKLLETNPFLGYASLHWASHIQHASDQQLHDMWSQLKTFFSDKIAMNIAEGVWIQLDKVSLWETEHFWEWAPVSSACSYAARFDIPHVLQRLLGSQESDLVNVNDYGTNGATLLIRAACYGADKTVEFLLRHGADPNIYPWAAKASALHFAVENCKDSTISSLLEAGAHLESVDRIFRRTPLLLAVGRNRIHVAKLLIDAGADINTQHRRDVAPIFGGNDPEVVEILLDAGADYDHKSNGLPGSTPVHLCVRFAGLQCAKLLIDIGANLNALDHEGNTPLAIAIYKEMWETTEILMDAGGSLDGMSPEDLNPLDNDAWRSVGKDDRSTLDRIGHLVDQAKVYYWENMAEHIARASHFHYIRDLNYRTPLAVALIRRKWRYAKDLLESPWKYDFNEMHIGALEEVEALIRNGSAWIDPDLLQRIQEVIDRARECWEQRRRDGFVSEEETSGTGTQHQEAQKPVLRPRGVLTMRRNATRATECAVDARNGSG
ncbi:hypothetical protein VTJ04DRAFT_4989 [Mycothermus thermophilus]|uniref:uncharacterized protein n=1 Tax=Humicola insolens TaxID=85995 RepID=UPI00374392E2